MKIEGGSLSEPKRDWLIWESRNEPWWGPDWKGYTRNILEAGLYTEDEADRIKSKPNDTRRDLAIHVSNEREQIERLRSGLARMDEALAVPLLVEVCLGCMKRTATSDCGCPAGTGMVYVKPGCDKPPSGWVCTRGVHDGPCAAIKE